jgi:hypothetical protein
MINRSSLATPSPSFCKSLLRAQPAMTCEFGSDGVGGSEYFDARYGFRSMLFLSEDCATANTSKSLQVQNVARLTSHVTCHTSHVARHTSHVTCHTSHVTPTSPFPSSVPLFSHPLYFQTPLLPQHSPSPSCLTPAHPTLLVCKPKTTAHPSTSFRLLCLHLASRRHHHQHHRHQRGAGVTGQLRGNARRV